MRRLPPRFAKVRIVYNGADSYLETIPTKTDRENKDDLWASPIRARQELRRYHLASIRLHREALRKLGPVSRLARNKSMR